MARKRQKRYAWAALRDQELLNQRFCDLKLDLGTNPILRQIEQLYAELELHGISFRPHCWFSEEWFSPDGVPGIAIPFYLAHPRLARLEFRQMHDVEGGTARRCMQLLRHEAGHAINTAYRLHRRNVWKRTFGSFSKTYPLCYTPDPESKRYVLHLDWWYAQSHPAEDFAETFSVWLGNEDDWRKEYRDWPAMRKLETMSDLMNSISRKTPVVRSREQVEPVSTNRKTLREYYRNKRNFYGMDGPLDDHDELLRLFTPRATSRRSAAGFLLGAQSELVPLCARSLNKPVYVISQIYRDLIMRCRRLKLGVARPEQHLKIEVAILISNMVTSDLRRLCQRVPV